MPELLDWFLKSRFAYGIMDLGPIDAPEQRARLADLGRHLDVLRNSESVLAVR